MSITRMTKVTLLGTSTEQKLALSDLQTLGCVHLISLHEEPKPVALTAPGWNESLAGALRHLAAAPQRQHQEIDPQNLNIEEIVKATLKNKERQRELADHLISLRSRISQLSPWGNFVLPPLDEIGGYRLWFYRVPLRELKKVNQLTDPWEVVAKDHRFAYLVVIAKEEPRPGLLPRSAHPCRRSGFRRAETQLAAGRTRDGRSGGRTKRFEPLDFPAYQESGRGRRRAGARESRPANPRSR